MNETEKKTVLVQVVYPDESTKDYELTFKSVAHGKGDILTIQKELCSKSQEIRNFLSKGGLCEFLKESVALFPGRWTHVGENSPIKHKTVLRCALAKRKKLSFDDDKEIEKELQTKDSRISSKSKTVNVDNYSCHDKEQLSDGNASPDLMPSKKGKRLKVSTTKSPNKTQSTSRHQSSGSVNMTDSNDDDFEILQCPDIYFGNKKVKITKFPSMSNQAVSQQPSCSTHVHDNDEEPRPCNITHKTSSGKDNKDSKSSSVSLKPSVRIDLKKWKLPTNYGVVINDILAKQGTLSEPHLSAICRRVVDSLEELSLSPCGESLRIVVHHMFEKYPSTQIDSKDRVSSSRAIVAKLQRILSRRRLAAGQPQNTNGGRPKVANCVSNLDPGVHSKGRNNEDVDDTIDTVSYKANYEKLIELYQQNGTQVAMKSLFRQTFKGRRFKITKGHLTSITDILKLRCPVLNQQNFLFAELDLILGDNTCKLFRTEWEKVVPVVIAVAQKSNSAAVKKILNYYQSSIEKKNFESESCAVLEFLPVLTPGSKQAMKWGNYFFYLHEDTANMSDVIRKQKKETPFILKIGETSFTIIVDSTLPLIESVCSTEALLQLIAVYYVFDIQWCKKVLPTLRFIRTDVMKLEDDVPTQNISLALFVRQFKEMYNSMYGEKLFYFPDYIGLFFYQ